MLDKQRDIEAVVIATPDHLHAVIAYAAMKAGKHVYVQKPLTYSVHEARVLAQHARETKVVTQMGNQGHSREGTRRIDEWIAGRRDRPGARGAHLDRPARAILGAGHSAPRQRPTPPRACRRQRRTRAPSPPRWNVRTVERAVLARDGREPADVPAGLRWDLYLGPAQGHAVSPGVSPVQLARVGGLRRGRHRRHGRAPHRPAVLGARPRAIPTSIEASSTPWGGPANNPGTYPLAMTVRYEFPARGRSRR